MSPTAVHQHLEVVTDVRRFFSLPRVTATRDVDIIKQLAFTKIKFSLENKALSPKQCHIMFMIMQKCGITRRGKDEMCLIGLVNRLLNG